MGKILSVSVAAYNIENYIEEALNPFINVKNRDKLEVLIVDDGSTDNTLEIAKEYEVNYPEIFKVIHKENGGWGSTVTTGIHSATGKYFKQLDGDDYYNSNELSLFLDELESCEADMVITPFLKFYDGTDKTEAIDNPFYFPKEKVICQIDDIPVSPYSIEMYALTFRTDVLRSANISITENCFYTDNEYVFKACNVCKSIIRMPFSIYCYRLARPGQSVSSEGMKRHYKEFEHILRKLLCFAKTETKNLHLKEIYYERLRAISYYYFEILVSMESDKCFKKEFCMYDLWLKKEFFEIYKNIKYPPLRILRFTNYLGYSFVLKLWKNKMNKKEV